MKCHYNANQTDLTRLHRVPLVKAGEEADKEGYHTTHYPTFDLLLKKTAEVRSLLAGYILFSQNTEVEKTGIAVGWYNGMFKETSITPVSTQNF